ncbi:autoinducer binding domain-containing protein [Ralstonia mannitolilytica]
MVSPLYTFEGLLTARSHAEIAAFMERHAGNLGYGRFFYSPLLVAGDARHFFKDDHNVVEAERLYTKNIFTTYPASWIRRYQEAGHVAADPVVKLITTSNLPIHWDADDLQAARSRVFDEAREHGLATGITIPINGFDQTRALFSVTSDQAPRTLATPHRRDIRPRCADCPAFARSGAATGCIDVQRPDTIADVARERMCAMGRGRQNVMGNRTHPLRF